MNHNRKTPMIARRVNWRIDPDGMMRVTANILKEGIFPYARDDFYDSLPDDIKERIADRDIVFEYIDPVGLAEDVLSSLEGKPVVVDEHEWQTANESDTVATEAKEVGAVAGKPRISDDGYIVADLVIKDAETIERIKKGDLVEISAGYMAEINPEPGEYKGKEYDLSQSVTRFNHVAVLPYGKGRCGHDVKILNTTEKKEITMHVIQKQVGNKVEKFNFDNEQDCREAERMAEILVGVEETKRQNAEDEAAEKEKALEDLKKENESLGAEKSALEEKLDAILIRLDKLAGFEVREQEADEEAIVTEELNSEDADEVKEEIAKENSLDVRRKTIVCAVARENSLDASRWSQDAIDSQFQLLAAKAKKAQEIRQNAKPRNSEIRPPEGGYKRQNAGGENRFVKTAQARSNKK